MLDDIHSFLDYRQFLQNWYSESGVSYRQFAEKAGVKAPNFLQWLIEGKRNLAEATIPRVVGALGLKGNDAAYFRELVLFNQAQTISEKTFRFKALAAFRKSAGAKPVEETQYEYYRNWYVSAIREVLRMYDFNMNEKWAYRKLARLLKPEITETQARHAIQQMLELGLVVLDDRGFVRQADRAITSGDEVRSFCVKKFHESMVDRAKESMDLFPSEERDISSLTMCVSKECRNLIKRELQLFRKQIMDLIDGDRIPDQVIQLNFQMFPLTNAKKLPPKGQGT